MKKIVKVVLFLMIFTILWLNLSWILQRPQPQEKTHGFFSEEADFDVLFFGSSHILNGIYTSELWDKYGIASYNLGNHAEIIKTTYHNIRLALRHKKPKIIVLDVFATEPFTPSMHREYIHNMLDPYPLSIEKYEAVTDLMGNDIKTLAEYLLPLTKYHSRWTELTKTDFSQKISTEKGSEARVKIYKDEINTNIEYKDNTDNYNLEYIKKIKELCDKNNIILILTYTPSYVSDKYNFSNDFFAEFSKEIDVDYIDSKGANLINVDIDFYDNGMHLNPSGARKNTNYIGQYLVEKYNLQNHKNDNKYEKWNQDYDNYITFKKDTFIANKTNSDIILMLLYGENNFDFSVNYSEQLLKDHLYSQLITNIQTDNVYKTVLNDNNDLYVKIIDKRNDKIILEEYYDVI